MRYYVYKIKTLKLLSMISILVIMIFGFGKINVNAEEFPTIDQIYNEDKGYGVLDTYIHITNSDLVSNVQAPTWSNENGQDDLIWNGMEKCDITIDGINYNYNVSTDGKAHKHVFGMLMVQSNI